MGALAPHEHGKGLALRPCQRLSLVFAGSFFLHLVFFYSVILWSTFPLLYTHIVHRIFVPSSHMHFTLSLNNGFFKRLI